MEEMVTAPRKLILAATFVILAAVFSTASDIYIAQNAAGGNTGADCADAHPASWFNSSSNWGSKAGLIGPGTTVHLCGTFTAQAGTSWYLNFQGGGNSVSPITLLFEIGAVLTAAYWSGPAISLNGQSYITVDGGTNGTIQATANGTGLANKQDNGTGIWFFNSSNVQIKNMTIANLYVHTCTLPITNCTDEDGQNTYGISGLGGSNIQIGPNNTVHDMKWCIADGYGSGNSNIQYFQNTVYDCDHGFVFGDANIGGVADSTTGSATATCGGNNGNMICENDISNGGNWDDAGVENHHDGMHTWANNTSSSYYVIIEGNYIHGNWGVNAGSLIYVEANEQNVPIFNNVLEIDTNCPGAGTGMLGVATGSGTPGSGAQIFDNTLYSGNGPTCTQAGIQLSTTTSPVIKNNIVVGAGSGVSLNPNGSVTGAVVDYNDYYNIGTANPFYCPGEWGVSFSVWQNACGFDAHGTTGNPLLTETYHLTSSSSAAWQTGTNLHGLGITALDSDKNGVARASAWDRGAYEDSASSGAPAPPTGLSAAVQ